MADKSSMPISWHEQTLKNVESYVDREKKNFERAKDNYDRALEQLNFYRFQIESAKKEGKDSFDGDKYKIDSRKKI
jgi:hypothetical protein